MKLHFEPDLAYQRQAIDAVCDLFRGQETAFSRAMQGDLGVGNHLELSDEHLLRNLQSIQVRNGLDPSDHLSSRDFTVEMETGTGKTYVYLRTLFELNRRFGFTKFVIVVPSVAIKEGVQHSLRAMQEHFRALYGNVPFESFQYDSKRLGQVRAFAASQHIQVMVVTVGAINKQDVNNLYRESEHTGGFKPIDLIRATHPILIVDEPQSVDGGLQGQGRKALGEMRPLCTLRYSATHVARHHMVYRLDAVDAYEQELVKQIEVASASVAAGHNTPYVRVIAVRSIGGAVSARVELDVRMRAGVRRKRTTVRDGDNLERMTDRALYTRHRVGQIQATKGREQLTLHTPDGEVMLRPGQVHGGPDPLQVARAMIRRTIQEHLDKELRLAQRGIKILSLFFIDAVERYRRYGADGNALKGDYALIFEEEYRLLAAHPDYRCLFAGVDLNTAAEAAHNGYFSIDRRKIGNRTVEVFKDTLGGTKADDATYHLIMRDKERLLSFDTPLKFLFSHSALREGWDNPNVFQICTLREMNSELQCRQTIGRGLRLCVNQHGERQRGFDVNTLTVIATESYEQFAAQLQKELEADTGIRFGARLRIRNANRREALDITPETPLEVEFRALWERVSQSVTYRVQFDSEALICDCVAAIRSVPPFPTAQLRWRVASLFVGREAVEAKEGTEPAAVELDTPRAELPDVLTLLQDQTGLTRRTLYRILTESGRLQDLQRDPQRFIDLTTDAVRLSKQRVLSNGIRYQRQPSEPHFTQELFQTAELTASRRKTVRIYAQLPPGFTAVTPLGPCTPACAVLAEDDGIEYLYLLPEVCADFVNVGNG